jgi:hypothetical protein
VLGYNFPLSILLYCEIKDDNNFKLITAKETKDSLRMHELLHKGFVSSFFKQLIYFVGFEVLTAAVAKICVLWNITPCSLLKVNQCFGGTCCFHFQG